MLRIPVSKLAMLFKKVCLIDWEKVREANVHQVFRGRVVTRTSSLFFAGNGFLISNILTLAVSVLIKRVNS